MIQASHRHTPAQQTPEQNLNLIEQMTALVSQPVTISGNVIMVHAKQLERVNYSLQANIKAALTSLPEQYTVEWLE